MPSCCSNACESTQRTSVKYRRVLWIALILNAAMFCVELIAGQRAHSASLLADAIDFLGDAGNYSISLFALSLGLLWRARAAMFKAVTMGLFGFFVLGRVGWGAFSDVVPHATIMGAVGFVALAVNVSVAMLLYAFREGDANMRSVWLCSRNDAIGNVGVMCAALAVSATGSAWPDLAVALIMGGLALTAARSVIIQARREIAIAGRAQNRDVDLRAGTREAQPSLREAYWNFRDAARVHEHAGRTDGALACLEAAHVLGQRSTVLHTKTHIAMLAFGWRRRDHREFVGQLLRMLAALFATWIWVPAGNTGGADVSPFRAMPIPEDLRVVLGRNDPDHTPKSD